MNELAKQLKRLKDCWTQGCTPTQLEEYKKALESQPIKRVVKVVDNLILWENMRPSIATVYKWIDLMRQSEHEQTKQQAGTLKSIPIRKLTPWGKANLDLIKLIFKQGVKSQKVADRLGFLKAEFPQYRSDIEEIEKCFAQIVPREHKPGFDLSYLLDFKKAAGGDVEGY